MTGRARSSGIACVSGSLIRQQRDVMQARYGKGAVARALERLTADDRERIDGALPIDWIPIKIQQAFYSALAVETGKPIEEIHGDIARESTKRNIRTLWKVLLRFTSDAALIARAPIFFSKSYNRGMLDATLEAPGSVRISLRGWPDVPDFSLRGLRIGIETILREAGRREVRVTCERGRDGAELRVSWLA
jgi:hypothetical protein